ncbi:NAD(P)H-dependent glycerol-3-phosphate dehydrogenase [Fundicoccus culcitae]|uniref:Glycerol-3-phosphate dehydrogenase [NAD(P)+] n=1 Tax=Fundicoccus culcitae TaxID=2969821 RepID=A0ABY5P2T4_9LACT|nr:NAD(P)H-dependent glycerol-3-phosphate dehydrogenase [Fundicoccus culcitae]UUX32920.1 NAD(P)H-dependent glycerol-3-phosphate dehydrogenase [Fundicoccus culcitae]
MKIAVLGTGSWGSALAKVLAENAHTVQLWGRNTEVVASINQHHKNEQYLGDTILPHSIKATTNLEHALEGVDLILIVVPTIAIRSISQAVAVYLKKNPDHQPILVHATKGLELDTHLRVSEIIESEISSELYQSLVVLSGPSHAEEVARRDITTITAASHDLEASGIVQKAFMNDYFRVYTNEDVIGVELGAALKNIIAIVAGISAELGYGDNAKAGLITRGLAEITRLGVALGADPLTFSGLSGVGDLIVTCTSPHSRNWQAGKLLAQGYSMDEVNEKIKMVVEGFTTTKAAYELAQKQGVEMPITEALYRLLYEESDIRSGLSGLMSRVGKQEASLEQHLGSQEAHEISH